MAKKSDKRPRARTRSISATEASRSFSTILDAVERGGRFVVRRRGRDVCVIAPPPIEGRLASECIALLRARGPVRLDDRFGEDLLAVIREEPAEERPTWGS